MAALTLDQAARELRHCASRLRQEMEPQPNYVSYDGKGFQPWFLLMWAMLEAVHDEHEAYWKYGDDIIRRFIYDRAIELCRSQHGHLGGETPERLIVGSNPGQENFITKVPDPFNLGIECKPVNAIQYNLSGIIPLWMHYIGLARQQLEREGKIDPIPPQGFSV